MINDHDADVLLVLSLAVGVEKWPIASVMEFVGALSATTGPLSRTESHKQDRGASKWSYSYVKELLLNAPRPPKTIFPSHTETVVLTEFTAITAPPQPPLIYEITPTCGESIATAETTAHSLGKAPQCTDGSGANIPPASKINEVVLPHANITESANTANQANSSNSAGQIVSEAALIIRLSSNLYISPNMRTDYWSQELWTEQIKGRLNAELWHALRKERYLQEFLMAGSQSDDLRPSVIITCCGESAAKRVRKVLKRLKWLRDFDVPCAVVVDTIHLYSEEQQYAEDPTPLIEAQLPPNPATMCGTRIRRISSPDDRQPFCTLGGLILIDGIPFGMTVEHAFKSGFELLGSQRANEEDVESSARSLDDDEESSGSPFVSFDDEDDSDSFEDSTKLLHEPVQLPRVGVGVGDSGHGQPTLHPNQEDLEEMLYRRIGEVFPSIERNELTIQHSGDWALIDFEDPSCFVLNEVKLPGRDVSTIIDEVIPEGLNSEGHVDVVLAGGVIRSGWLMSSSALLKVGSFVLDTRLIVMDNKLAYGDSGAWVVHDGRLCGHIIGGKGHLPWAYMVPIHQIIEEIKVAFGAHEVRLPKNANELSTRMIRQEPTSGVAVATYDDEECAIISPPPPLQSARSAHDLDEIVIYAEASSSQPQIQATYRFPTNELARASTPAQNEMSVDDINAVSKLPDTLLGSHDPESWVPRLQPELKPSALQSTVSPTGSRRSQHADIVDDINPVFPLPHPHGPGWQDPESWVLEARNELEPDALQDIPTRMEFESSAARDPPPLPTAYVKIDPPGALASWDVSNSGAVPWWKETFFINVLVLMLLIGLVVGLAVGLTRNSAAASLPTSLKIGIGIGAGFAGLILLGLMVSWDIRYRRRRKLHHGSRRVARSRSWTRIWATVSHPAVALSLLLVLLLVGTVLGLSIGLTHSDLPKSHKIGIGIGVGVGSWALACSIYGILLLRK